MVGCELIQIFWVLPSWLGRAPPEERRAGGKQVLAFRENPLPSFLFFLLSGQNRIIKESSSRKWVYLECGPFSQNPLAFHPHVPALEVIPFTGCLGLRNKEEKCLPFYFVGFFGSHFLNCPQNESGRGREGEPNLAPRSLGWEEHHNAQGIIHHSANAIWLPRREA